MSTQLTRPIMDYLAWIIPSLIALAGLIIDHWNLAGSFASGIWQQLFVNIWFLWLAAGVYGAVRLGRFTKDLYLRFLRLEERLESFETEARNRLDAEIKSRVAGDNTSSKTSGVELKNIREVLREEVSQRQKLERQVAELSERLSVLTKREPTSAELLATSGRTRAQGLLSKSARSLADMQTPSMLSTGSGVLNRAAPSGDGPLCGRPVPSDGF